MSSTAYRATELVDPVLNPMARQRLPLIPAAPLVGALFLLAAAPAAAQRTVPDGPRNVQVVVSDSALMLTWQAPSSWGSFPAAGYQIDWAEGTSAPAHSSTDWKRAVRPDLAADATKFIFADRTYGTTYHLRLRAFTANPGDPSDTLPSSWVAKSGTPSHSHGPPPGKPTLALVTSGQHAQTATTLSFTIPCVSPGRAPVTDYVLRAEKTGSSALTQYFTVPSPCRAITVTLTGLESATTYRVRAFARNLRARYSEWSDYVQGTTVALQIGGGGNNDPEPTDPLTASFEQVPSEHDGKAAFDLLVRLSETVGNFSKSPRKSSFAVRNGRVRSVEQAEAGLWRVRVKPDSWRDVTVRLAGGRDCDTEGAVCTPDGRALTNSSEASVGGPPVRIRIQDGKAREGRDAGIDFAVTLNRASSETVSVGYTTADGTAKAGEDYEAVSGTLTFAAGETEKTVHVPILDDDVDEGREKFEMRLSNESGANLRGRHNTATGTILADDNGESAAPTVSLSASPSAVAEGSDVTVTATLSSTLSSDVTIPLSLSHGTAEDGDYGSLSGITILAGFSSATGTITTTDDGDADDETFTVALGTLPPGVEAGSSSSVTVTITDDDVTQEQTAGTLMERCASYLPSNAVSVSEVTGWRDAHSHDAAHVLRWNRVLKALGEDVGAGVSPMTVAEAKANEGRFMRSRWARVTKTLEAIQTCLANSGQNWAPTVLGLADLSNETGITYTLSRPLDPNIVEGESYELTATASAAVEADTTVEIMRDAAASDADEDDYSVEPILIEAGETTGATMLMVTADDLPDGGTGTNRGETLVLFGSVGGMKIGDLTFTIWDAAVPALPVGGAFLLGLLLAWRGVVRAGMRGR